MKKRLLVWLLALIMVLGVLPAVTYAAGNDDYEIKTLTFEGTSWNGLIDNPQYGGPLLYDSSGMGFNSLDEAYKWTDTDNTGLSSRLCSAYGSYCYWSGGHAVSNYVSGDVQTYGDYNSQLTVFKQGVTGLERTGGGHNGSDNFAVHYGYMDNSPYNMVEELPALSFSDGKARVIDSMWVNNTCYAANCYLSGNGLTPKINEGDWVKLIATGYNGETKGSTAEIYLCNGPDHIVTDWTQWDLSGLGAVTKVTFNVTGSSDNGYGFSQPAYFAYDDVAVRFPKEAPAQTGIETKIKFAHGTAKLFAKNDTEENTDYLNGVEKTNNIYTVDVPEGDYVFKGYDGDTFLGSIELTVSEGHSDFSGDLGSDGAILAVTLINNNADWVYDTDFTFENVGAVSGGQTASTARTIVMGDSITANRKTVLIHEGDTVMADLVPKGDKASSYAVVNASRTCNAGFDTLTLTPVTKCSAEVTYPYADTNEDGKNDFELEFGILKSGTYYVYDYYTPALVSDPADGTVTATFNTAKNTTYFYKVSNPLSSDAVSYGNYVKTANSAEGKTEIAVTQAQMYIGDDSKNKDTVIRDYSNNDYDSGDLYLASNAKNFWSKDVFGTGNQGVIRLDTTDNSNCTLYPYRNWLIIEGISNAQVIEPDFHVQVINVEGNPITVTENTANDAKKHSYDIQANGTGTAVLLVSYDAVTADQAMGKGKFFSAIRPENTGVIVVTVNGTEDVVSNMLSPAEKVNTAMNETGNAGTGNAARTAGQYIDAELDRLYFCTNDGATYSFTPETGTTVTMAKGVQNGTVNFSSDGVAVNDGVVTLSGIPEGKSIVKLTNGDKVSYQVIRATRTDLTVKDAAGNVYYDSAAGTLDPNMKFAPGEKVTLIYSKLEHPAQKLSGIYNMNCTVVPYGDDIEVEKGGGYGVYTFNSTPASWATTAVIPASANGTYSLSALIRQTGFGSYYGDHRILAYEVGKSPNFVAVQQNAWFALPGIDLPMATSVPMTVKLMDEQDTEISNATVTFSDANGRGITPDENGVYTVFPGKTYNYEATAEGRKRVLSSVTVPADAENYQATIVIPLLEAGEWDGSSTSEPAKDGDVYQIGTGAELAWFAQQVTGGTGVSYNATLTADINLGNFTWTPIGTSTSGKQYKGTFDGNGYVINNLYIDAAATTHQGLFGYLAGATVKNLGVTGSITSSKNQVGGIAAYANASAKIQNCYNAANITGAAYVGGIVGQALNGAKIENCYNTGNITATAATSYCGGINGGSMTCAVATNCYNIGMVDYKKTGGAINPGAVAKGSNCYYLEGCCVNAASSTAGTAKTAADMKALASTLGDAFMNDTHQINAGYPVLKWQHRYTDTDFDGNCDECDESLGTVKTAAVDYTSQNYGAFLHAPKRAINVSSNLAERYGYKDGVNYLEDVSVLDVLVQAHIDVFGDEFTKTTANTYLTMLDGSPSRQFGVDSDEAFGGFLLNHAVANDGTQGDWGYNGTLVGTQKVVKNDVVEFFFYNSPYWMDSCNWFEGENGYSRSYTLCEDENLVLTLKNSMVMAGSAYKDEAEMIAAGTAVEDAQLYTVNMETGVLTAITGAKTDEDGKVTLDLAPGTYTIAAYEEDTPQILSLTDITVKNHNLIAHAAVEPTYTEAGNTAYWSCDVCGKFFSDANAENEIAENSWVLNSTIIDEINEKQEELEQSLEETKTALETAIANLTQEIADRQEAINALSEQLNTMQNETIKGLSDDLADLEEELNAAKTALNEAKTALEGLKAESEQTDEKLAAQISAVENKVGTIEATLQTLGADQDTEGSIANIAKQYTDAAKAELQTQLESVDDRVKAIEDADYSGSLAELKANIEKVSGDVAAMNIPEDCDLTAALANIAKLQKDLADLEKASAEELEKAVAELTAKTSAHDAEIAELKAFGTVLTAKADLSGLTKVTVSWNKNRFADGYVIYTMLPGETAYDAGTELGKDAASYGFSGMKEYSTYKFKVVAFVKNGTQTIYGEESNEVVVTPKRPVPAKVTLKKAVAGKKKATITWKAVKNATGYQVYYKQAGKKARTVKVKGAKAIKKVVKKLVSKKKYTVKVRAYNKTGYGKWSKAKVLRIK